MYSVVVVGLVSFLLINWVVNQRHIFKGPSIDFALLHAARHDELLGHRTLEGVAVGDDGGVIEALRQRSFSEAKKV